MSRADWEAQQKRASFKKATITAAINTAVVLMALAVPFGAFMGFYTDNGNWFWLCLFLVLFLS